MDSTDGKDLPVTSSDVAPFPTPSDRAGVVSDRKIMATARALRAISHVLEWLIFLLIAASVAAIGSVNAWAYVPLWYAAIAILVIAAVRTTLVARLRAHLGPQQFCFHTSGRWLVLDEESPYGIRTWGFDLARPLVPRTPLLLPALCVVGWIVVQLLAVPPRVAAMVNITQPLSVTGGEPWRPISVAVMDTRRGLAFVLMALAFHLASVVAFDRRDARATLLKRLRLLGLLLSLAALAQLASGTHLVLWFYAPQESDGNNLIFGPFVNRNHYAAYMLMLTPLAFGWLASCLRDVSRNVGRSANLRRVAVNVLQHGGPRLVYAALPAFAMVASLVATTSRGALVAFAGGLFLASLRLMKRSQTPSWAMVLLLSGLAVAWFGFDRMEERFGQAAGNAAGRTDVWRDSLRRMEGRWITGFGFNTFSAAISRTTAWTLPVGATPWTDPYETSIAEVARAGYRTITPGPEHTYYREAHNDYLQLLTEVGVVGLGLVLWGAVRLVKRVWPDPWLLAAVVGPLLHAFVEFGFQLPAVAVLFAVVSALRPERR